MTSNRAQAIRICNRGNGKDNDVRILWRGWHSCRPNKSGGGSGGSGSSDDGGYYNAPAPEISPTQLPMGAVRVAAALGPDSGIQFQRFDHYAVGNKAVADMGVLDVVDVWGQADQYFEICFPQAGQVIFLDAATSPRSVVHIDTFKSDGYNCGAMNRAGTMVLVKSTGGSSANSSDNLALAQSFIDSTNDPVDSAIALLNCIVTPEHNLNMRDEPWGEIITVVPKDFAVVASARTQSWFQVTFVEADADAEDTAEDDAITHEGWIAAWLSQTEGACAWDGDAEDSPALASSRFLAEDEQPAILLANDLAVNHRPA